MKRKHIIFLMFPLLMALTFCCKTPQNEGEADMDEKEDFNIPEKATDTWFVHSFSDINTYSSSRPTNKYTLALARNETEHVQLVIKTKTNETLTIEHSGKLGGIDVDCRALKMFEKMEDVLVPCGGEVKPENKLVKVWISYTTTKRTKEGRYKDVIKFKNGTDEYVVGVTLNVENVIIPETPSIPSVFGIEPNNFIMTGFNLEQKWAKHREAAELLLGYRISPYFSTWLNGTMQTECYSSPYPWNDDRTWDFLEDKRFNRIAFPFHKLSDYDLGAMLNKIRSKGLMDKAYFYVWDEPTLVSEYSQIHAMADKIHSKAADAKVLTTFYCGPDKIENIFPVFGHLDGATDIFCTSTYAMFNNENNAAQCIASLKPGQEWWSYVCMSERPGLAQNSTGIPNRVVMWRNWKEGNTGFLFWSANSFNSVYPLRSKSSLPEGDGILIYPGEPFGTDKICVSIRLERWRDGAEDYELLNMYEKRKGRSAAEALLANVYTGPENYTDNVKHLDAFKKNLIEGIAE